MAKEAGYAKCGNSGKIRNRAASAVPAVHATGRQSFLLAPACDNQ